MKMPFSVWLRHHIGPALLKTYAALFFLFMILPIAIVVVISFNAQSSVSFPISGFSLRWFRRFFEYQPYVNSLIVSIEIALLSALVAALIGVPAALALARSNSKLASSVVAFLLSPLSLPHIVLGFALLFFLSSLGLGVSFVSLLIAHVVASLPYIVRTVLGVYRSVSPGMEEVAMVLGAGRWNVFRYITLPLIGPGVFSGCLLSILLSIDNLSVSLFFASPATNTLPVVMLSYMETQFDPSIAAASTVQLAIMLVALIAVEKLYGLRGVQFGK